MSAPHSLDELLRELPWLRRLATAMVGVDRAEDVVQDTLVAAFHRRSAGGEFASVRAWLRTVLQNRVRRLARRDAQRREVEGEAARTSATSAGAERDAAELLARADLHRALVEEVTALPRDQRLVVLLRCFEQLEFAAIAVRLGIGMEAARSRWRRALSTLRQRLDERTGERAAWVALLAPRSMPVAPPTPPPVTKVVRGAPVLGLAVAFGATLAVVHVTSSRSEPVEQLASTATPTNAPASPREPTSADPADAVVPPRVPAPGASRRASVHTFVAVGASASTVPADLVPGPERAPRPVPTEPPVQLSVLDETGLPVADASLQAMPTTAATTAAPWPDSSGDARLWTGRTGPDGTVQLPWSGATATACRVRVRRGEAWIDLGAVVTRPGHRAIVRLAGESAAAQTNR